MNSGNNETTLINTQSKGDSNLSSKVTRASRFSLNGEWQFSQSGTDLWLPAKVPGCNFTDLMANQRIDDPFYRDNESALQWIELEDWHYRRDFYLDKKSFNYSEIELIAEGLDTFCDIFINGEKIGESNNMFVGHRLPCKSFLRLGENSIEIRFRSPIKETLPRHYAAGFTYPAENDKSDEKLSVYCRKAPCHFGWDWGPRFVTSGIWRDIYLQAVEPVKIDNLYFSLAKLTDSQAVFSFQLNVQANTDFAGQLRVRCLQAPELDCVDSLLVDSSNSSEANVNLAFNLSNPRKWWPNGLGEAFLYEFVFELIEDKKVVSFVSQKIGLRTIEVINSRDKDGESFYLKVNGENVFMKGANYIPDDSFLNRVTEARHRALFDASKQANMNMLRVWGGGVYQDDYFYQLADEYGILIWQDFMFACTLYPADDVFLENVKQEAEYNILRLRNHPCIALWCGNNEVDMAIKHWDWPEKFDYSESLFTKLKSDYMRLFDVCLREAVTQFDSQRFYLRSSPIGSWESDEDHIGNHHYWGVWHGEEPFSEYQKRIPRFMSEFGFQSFPLMSSLQKFTLPQDLELQSAVMQVHQKHPRGNALIHQYMASEYQSPKDFAHLLYVSQVQQSLGLKLAFEAHRKAMPFCMGTLYWQLNDTWPAASWSGIDYYGKWKALHYQARRCFAQQLLVIEQEQEKLTIQLVSDSLKPLQAKLELGLFGFDGTEHWTDQCDVSIAGNTSSAVFSINNNALLAVLDLSKVVFSARLLDIESNVMLAENLYYFVPSSQLALLDSRLDISYQMSGNTLHINLRAELLMRQVYFEIPDSDGNFSDNFIDLLAGQPKAITLLLTDKETENVSVLIGRLRWVSLYDSALTDSKRLCVNNA